jgi:hypothetical protein
VLDWYMLKLFVKSLLFFVLLGSFFCTVYLILVYFLSEDLWYEYFPPSDDDEQVEISENSFVFRR